MHLTFTPQFQTWARREVSELANSPCSRLPPSCCCCCCCCCCCAANLGDGRRGGGKPPPSRLHAVLKSPAADATGLFSSMLLRGGLPGTSRRGRAKSEERTLEWGREGWTVGRGSFLYDQGPAGTRS